MTATTTDWGLEYQTYADPADVAAALQALATTADTAVEAEAETAATSADKPSCRLTGNATQNVASGAETTVTWPAGSEYYDNDGMLNNTATTSVITFNHTGVYLANCRVTFNAVAGVGIRRLTITHSGYGIVAQKTERGVSGAGNVLTITQIVHVPTVGQTITPSVFQGSGLSLPLGQRYFSALKLKDL